MISEWGRHFGGKGLLNAFTKGDMAQSGVRKHTTASHLPQQNTATPPAKPTNQTPHYLPGQFNFIDVQHNGSYDAAMGDCKQISTPV